MHPMKKFLIVLTVALAALAGRAALPQPDLIAKIHFAGGDKIAADKNYPAFANEFSSAEARALRQQVADKLAPWLAKNLAAAVPDGAAKLRPLLDDLQSAEWLLEARTGADGKADVAIAIKLDSAHAQMWQANLKTFFPAATFQSSGGWLIFDAGTGSAKCGANLAQKIAAPPTGWAGADINWPVLGRWSPWIKSLDLPETAIGISADATNLLMDGKFFFPQNLTLKLDAWQFPSNTVHQPFTSFTAVRGMAGWLKSQAWAQPFLLSPVQNQAFIWALNGTPFQTFCAVPVADTSAALRQLDAGLQPVLTERNAHEGFVSPMTLEVTNTQLTLIGAPMVAPYVRSVKEPNGEFLLAGAFPNTPRSKPLPPELFARLAEPSLVFYHWEITAQRFVTQLQTSQLSLMLTRHKQVEGESVPFKWVAKIVPALGNTVTEVKQTAPDQMTFSRKAPGGLTAFELLALANWLDAPDFPGCNLKLPPPSERMKKLRERRQAASPTSQVISIPALPH
jgi:hypothetical protein